MRITLPNFLRRAHLRFTDSVRNSKAVWEGAAFVGYLRSLMARKTERQLFHQAISYRRAHSSFLRRRLETRLSPWLDYPNSDIWRERRIGWKRVKRQLAVKTLDKTLIVKSPTPDGEKGVLYISFEYNWLRLIQHCDFKRLLQEYFLILASSSSPPDFASHWAFANIGPDPVFVQISNPSDLALHKRFQHRVLPLPIMASEWINPTFYEPRPHDKREIDILMVAGWDSSKRHWQLFSALRKMRRNLRVVLVGQDYDDRTADDVWREAKAFDVSNRIEMVRDAATETVTAYQCNSKAAVVPSIREGSCVVVSEYLFSDTPVGMMHDAHVGSKSYINHRTGVLLRPRTMAQQLSELVERSACYSPRAWALDHITCFHSTRTLNALFRDHCTSRGLPWTRQIIPFCWRPNPTYVNKSDASNLEKAYYDLYERHGVAVIGHELRAKPATAITETVGDCA